MNSEHTYFDIAENPQLVAELEDELTGIIADWGRGHSFTIETVSSFCSSVAGKFNLLSHVEKIRTFAEEAYEEIKEIDGKGSRAVVRSDVERTIDTMLRDVFGNVELDNGD